MPRNPRGGREDRTITASGLARLLERLDPDPPEAAREYEHLRRALVRFFEWRGASPAEECADDAIDRLAKRLEADASIGDVRQYAHGIARMVLLERRRRPSSVPLDEVPGIALADTRSNAPDDPLRMCFERCLAEVPDGGRSLLLAYYQGDGAVKIANRRQLAATHGLTENALRSRVQRLRERLERCIGQCVSRGV